MWDKGSAAYLPSRVPAKTKKKEEESSVREMMAAFIDGWLYQKG
jgi:hypothetical protein